MKNKLSVVIPCKNEVKHIEECIRAIYLCDLPTDIVISVLVVDGMSDDGTREKIKALKREYPSLFLLNNKMELTPYAFNIGVNAIEFDYLQIIGARHIVSTNYLDECLYYLKNNQNIWCAGGRILNTYTNNTSRIIASAMATSFGMGVGNFRTLQKTCFTDTVTSPMYPKFVFEKIGYFDERLIRNQDDDFNFRVHRAGGKILFIHDIFLKYYVRASLKNLRRQFFQYGYWKVFVNKKHKSITTLRQLVPLFFVIFLVLLPFSLLVPPIFFYIFSPIFVAYLLLVFVTGFKLIKESKDLLTGLLVYPTMHVTYGLGYIYGVIDFILLNKTPSDKQKRLSR